MKNKLLFTSLILLFLTHCGDDDSFQEIAPESVGVTDSNCPRGSLPGGRPADCCDSQGSPKPERLSDPGCNWTSDASAFPEFERILCTSGYAAYSADTSYKTSEALLSGSAELSTAFAPNSNSSETPAPMPYPSASPSAIPSTNISSYDSGLSQSNAGAGRTEASTPSSVPNKKVSSGLSSLFDYKKFGSLLGLDFGSSANSSGGGVGGSDSNLPSSVAPSRGAASAVAKEVSDTGEAYSSGGSVNFNSGKDVRNSGGPDLNGVQNIERIKDYTNALAGKDLETPKKQEATDPELGKKIIAFQDSPELFKMASRQYAQWAAQGTESFQKRASELIQQLLEPRAK